MADDGAPLAPRPDQRGSTSTCPRRLRRGRGGRLGRLPGLRGARVLEPASFGAGSERQPGDGTAVFAGTQRQSPRDHGLEASDARPSRPPSTPPARSPSGYPDPGGHSSAGFAVEIDELPSRRRFVVVGRPRRHTLLRGGRELASVLAEQRRARVELPALLAQGPNPPPRSARRPWGARRSTANRPRRVSPAVRVPDGDRAGAVEGGPDELGRDLGRGPRLRDATVAQRPAKIRSPSPGSRSGPQTKQVGTRAPRSPGSRPRRPRLPRTKADAGTSTSTLAGAASATRASPSRTTGARPSRSTSSGRSRGGGLRQRDLDRRVEQAGDEPAGVAAVPRALRPVEVPARIVICSRAGTLRFSQSENYAPRTGQINTTVGDLEGNREQIVGRMKRPSRPAPRSSSSPRWR